MQKQKTRRQRRPQTAQVKGKGDYAVANLAAVNDIDRRLEKIEKSKSKPSKGLGSALGGALGSAFGLGGLGNSLGSAVDSWVGGGDYELTSNSLIPSLATDSKSTSIPVFHSTRRGIRITEKEYLGEITGSINFLNKSFPLNATNPLTFPWLSRFAHQFEQWEPHGIIFEFRTTSSTFNGASQALGSVIMATDYDVTDTAYLNKVEMAQADYSNSTVPSSSAFHGIECDSSERPTKVFYCSSGSNTPLAMTTLGNFQIATLGMSVDNVVVGELWVSYDITFYKKQLSLVNNSSILEMVRSTPTTGTPWGTVPSVAYGLNGIRASVTTTVLTFTNVIPGNNYRFYIFFEATTSITGACSMVFAGVSSSISNNLTSSGNQYWISGNFVANNATVTMTNTGLTFVAGTQVTFRMFQVNGLYDNPFVS